MVAVLKNENRNTLAEKVALGEVSFEKAVAGLTQVELRIFYQKLDKAFRAKHAGALQGRNFFMKRDESWTLLN